MNTGHKTKAVRITDKGGNQVCLVVNKICRFIYCRKADETVVWMVDGAKIAFAGDITYKMMTVFNKGYWPV